MPHVQSQFTYRRGAITPLMALMLTMIMALLALAVDLGYIALVRAELQNAADASALAGAMELLDKSLLQGGSQTTATNKARTQAYNFAHNNMAGGVALAPDLNSSNTATGDILCGYFTNPSDAAETMSLTPPTGALYNAVQVRVYRASTHTGVGNGPVSLFFANALSQGTKNLQATATACIQGAVTGFKAQTPGRDFCWVLPYALDIDVWNDQIVNGNGPDDWTRSSTATITSGGDNIPETKLFPAKGVTTSGNFGAVDIGLPNNSTADVKRQIVSGVSKDDLAWFSAANGYPNGFKMSPDPSSPTGYAMILQGDTGVSAGVESELQSIMGQPRILPLYKSPVVGNGNNAQFTIVKFVGVTILEVKLTGSMISKHITIQPCFCVEPNTIGGGTAETSQYAVRPVALVR